MILPESGLPCVHAHRHAPPVQPFDWHGAVLLLGVTIYLWATLFTNVTTPFLLSNDQVFFWMDAQRLLHGERIYLDFFQFTPPGTDLVFLGAFELFGSRISVTNLVVLVLGILLCSLCYRISRSMMDRSQAVLTASLFVVFFMAGCRLQLTTGSVFWQC